MFFWRKGKAKLIRNEMNNIVKLMHKAESFHNKISKIQDIISLIRHNIELAEENIVERGEEVKSNPTIDVKYNNAIDDLTQIELEALRQLEEHLSYFDRIENENDLKIFIEKLEREAITINKREKESEAKLREWQTITTQNNLSKSTQPSLSIRTNDGVRWGKIVKVARQFGAKGVERRNHPYTIYLPNATRPISVSEDVSSLGISNQMRTQLGQSLPTDKIPTNYQLISAFKKGDLIKTFKLL